MESSSVLFCSNKYIDKEYEVQHHWICGPAKCVMVLDCASHSQFLLAIIYINIDGFGFDFFFIVATLIE